MKRKSREIQENTKGEERGNSQNHDRVLDSETEK